MDRAADTTMDIPDDDPATGHQGKTHHIWASSSAANPAFFFLSRQHTDQDVEEMQRPEGPEAAVTRRKAAPRHPTGHDAL